MAFDGIFTAAMARELKNTITGAKIEKVYQPQQDILILNLRTKQGKERLCISASGSHAGIYITEEEYTNPSNPRGFCMLMRKHLQGGRITGVVQLDTERLIELQIETADEMGYDVTCLLIAEVMGKHSNITLVDSKNNKIIDCIRRISIDVNRARQLLPGKTYEYPPGQGKTPIDRVTEDLISEIPDSGDTEKSVMSTIQGVSPALAATIAEDGKSGILKKINDIRSSLEQEDFVPRVYLNKSGIPKDFHAFDLAGYEGILKRLDFETLSRAAEYYYVNKVTGSRTKQIGDDLYKAVNQKLKKLYLKRQRLAEDISKAENSEHLRLYGELLTANIHLVKTGDKSVTVTNYYNNEEITIPLDVKYSPAKNAQNFYKKYGKSKTAVKEKGLQIEENDRIISYLESVLVFIENADSTEEITNVREELIEGGYLRRRKSSGSVKRHKIKPAEYETLNGMRVLVGRNNMENDALTMKLAGRNDLWFHTKDIHGSHVVLFTEGTTLDDIPAGVIYEVAALAAYHSKARTSENVPVDYVPIKYVKKPNGAKPGMVIFKNNRTVWVNPEIKK